MDKREAQAAAAVYLDEGMRGLAGYEPQNVIDAFVLLKMPVPEALGAELAAILQQDAPPGYVVKVEPYQGRVRVMYIKAKAAAAWAARPPEEHD